ncbi:MAG: hypothetical protein VX367_10725 [SAR324 cluster bacterium]|nr:hypothetical protein [SAR324 cluster bacterium]
MLKKNNKAGYTATSCGRLGRGAFSHFSLRSPLRTNRPIDRPTYRPTDGQKLL